MESSLEPQSQSLSAHMAIQVAVLVASSAVFVITSCIERLWPSERAARVEKGMTHRRRFLLRQSVLLGVLGVVLAYV